MNAKSLLARQLAPIRVFGAKTGNASILHQSRINCASIARLVASWYPAGLNFVWHAEHGVYMPHLHVPHCHRAKLMKKSWQTRVKIAKKCLSELRWQRVFHANWAMSLVQVLDLNNCHHEVNANLTKQSWWNRDEIMMNSRGNVSFSCSKIACFAQTTQCHWFVFYLKY